MQVLEVVDPEVIFRRYSYASSTTRTLIDHFEEMAGDLVRLGDAVGKVVVEFGCNDGVLIRPLRALGVIAVGVDPSDVAARASQEQGWPLISDYFTERSAKEVLRRFGPARIVTANNTFAHADDLDSIMECVSAILDEDGLFVFEVHYQGDLIELVQFDTVYHEHLCYYSVTSLTHLLSRFDFRVVDVERIPIHSGSIRVVAARAGQRGSTPIVFEILEKEKAWDIPRFQEHVATRRAELAHLVQELRRAGNAVVAYGAAGRATILLNYCGLGHDLIDYVVDMSPLRHGKLVPGVLIPIKPPEVFRAHFPEYALLTAWNYETEVICNEQPFLDAGGKFIIPLPEVRIAGK
jgi:methylation protein EvaC